MYLLSVSITKQNGMDDVNVNGLSDSVPIIAYKKFFGGKIYHFKHPINGEFNVVFRVKDITLCHGGGYRIWCEILSLKELLEKNGFVNCKRVPDMRNPEPARDAVLKMICEKG